MSKSILNIEIWSERGKERDGARREREIKKREEKERREKERRQSGTEKRERKREGDRGIFLYSFPTV